MPSSLLTETNIFVSFSILEDDPGGRSSVVERLLAKQKAVGSSPIARSIVFVRIEVVMINKARYPSG